MRFKPLPTNPNRLVLLAQEADRWLNHRNPLRIASRKLHNLSLNGYPPPDVCCDDGERCQSESESAKAIEIAYEEASAELERLKAEAAQTAPATPTLWDHVDWPFEWDKSEGGNWREPPPSWHKAYQDWFEPLAVFVAPTTFDIRSLDCDLVERLLSEVKDALETLGAKGIPPMPAPGQALREAAIELADPSNIDVAKSYMYHHPELGHVAHLEPGKSWLERDLKIMYPGSGCRAVATGRDTRELPAGMDRRRYLQLMNPHASTFAPIRDYCPECDEALDTTKLLDQAERDLRVNRRNLNDLSVYNFSRLIDLWNRRDRPEVRAEAVEIRRQQMEQTESDESKCMIKALEVFLGPDEGTPLAAEAVVESPGGDTQDISKKINPEDRTRKLSQDRLRAYPNGKNPFVALDGMPSPTSEAMALYIEALINADGSRVSFKEFKRNNPSIDGAVITREWKKLDKCILKFIERKPSTPARLMVDLLK